MEKRGSEKWRHFSKSGATERTGITFLRLETKRNLICHKVRESWSQLQALPLTQFVAMEREPKYQSLSFLPCKTGMIIGRMRVLLSVPWIPSSFLPQSLCTCHSPCLEFFSHGSFYGRSPLLILNWTQMSNLKNNTPQRFVSSLGFILYSITIWNSVVHFCIYVLSLSPTLL